MSDDVNRRQRQECVVVCELCATYLAYGYSGFYELPFADPEKMGASELHLAFRYRHELHMQHRSCENGKGYSRATEAMIGSRLRRPVGKRR